MMQHAQSIGAVNDAARPVDWHRETARQHPAGRRICNSTGICPLPITGTRAQRPSNRKSCPTRRGMCSTLHTLNCFNQNAKDAPIRIGASFQRGFAFGITRAEHLVGMHSESPGSNALPACIRICRSRTERPQARQDRLRREATRWPAGWERRTRERHFHGQDRRAPWHRCRTVSYATPASRRCPLPPAAPR